MSPPELLAPAFRRGLPEAAAARFPEAEAEALEAGLGQLVEAARRAWPTLELDASAFVAWLAERVGPDTQLPALHAGDLALAFACLLGDPTALTLFERELLARVPAVLKGALPAGLTTDDVLQGLRLKLFVRRDDAPPQLSTYTGRGALLHWLRAAAVRLTQDHARAQKAEVADADEVLAGLPALAGGGELAVLKAQFAPDFKAAFQEALAALSARDQNVLRLYYLDGSSPEEIGRLYATHRTTVWRWLTQCREALLLQTRKALAARAKVSDAELSSLMNAVHSQLDVSLSRMLRKP